MRIYDSIEIIVKNRNFYSFRKEIDFQLKARVLIQLSFEFSINDRLKSSSLSNLENEKIKKETI
jgi:hypothetical protein